MCSSCELQGANRKMLHENRRDEKRRMQGGGEPTSRLHTLTLPYLLFLISLFYGLNLSTCVYVDLSITKVLICRFRQSIRKEEIRWRIPRGLWSIRVLSHERARQTCCSVQRSWRLWSNLSRPTNSWIRPIWYGAYGQATPTFWTM